MAAQAGLSLTWSETPKTGFLVTGLFCLLQEDMDARDSFRNSVYKSNTKDFEYRTIFEFQTLFYKSAYSYCCCPCAFEHEFFLYIEDDGRINDAVYKRIEQSIVDGSCPHVHLGPKEWMKETSVYNAHVAVAVDNRDIKADTLHRALHLPTAIFDLKPSDIVLAKHKTIDVMHYYHLNVQRYGHIFYQGYFVQSRYNKLTCRRGNKNAAKIIINYSSFLETFVHAREEERIIHVLINETYTVYQLEDVIKFVMKENLAELQKIFLVSLTCKKIREKRDIEMLEKFVCSAIVYDQSDILTSMSSDKFNTNPEMNLRGIRKLCMVLNRKTCKEVLQLKGVVHEVILSTKQQMGRVKRICVFEHSVMTNFNCACPAIQRGQGSGFPSEGSS